MHEAVVTLVIPRGYKKEPQKPWKSSGFTMRFVFLYSSGFRSVTAPLLN